MRARLGQPPAAAARARAVDAIRPSERSSPRASATYAARRAAVPARCCERHGVAASGASGLNVWIPVDDETGVVGALLRARLGGGPRGAVPAVGQLARRSASRSPRCGAQRGERLAGDLAEVLCPGAREPQRDSRSSCVPSPPSTTIAPARRCAYAVAAARVRARRLRRPRAAGRGGASSTRATAALAMRLAYGAVQRKRDARPRDRAPRRAPGRAPRRAACSRRCASGCTSCSTSTGAPDYAVVADAVELAKAQARAGHGLVNAVLRRAARAGADALLDRSDGRDARAGRAEALAPRVDRAPVVAGARAAQARAR